MKPNDLSSRLSERYNMIETLEQRIAPAATINLPANPSFVTATIGNILVKAGQVLTTGANGGDSYLLYVAQGEVLVHITDLNGNQQVDFNEITGLSVGNQTSLVSFVDIHGDIVTDLNPNGSLTDGGKGDILLDANITEIDLRSLTQADFPNSSDPGAMVDAHLAMSSYSIYGNIYAGGGLGQANNPNSGLLIDNTGSSLQTAQYPVITGYNYYQQTEPFIGSIFAGTAASGRNFNFGATGHSTDLVGNILNFNPAPGEAGASIYNIGAISSGVAYTIGNIQAGNGGFNGVGGSVVNVALDGVGSGSYQIIAGNAGQGTTGHNGGSIVNFSDTGDILGQIVLQSGNGGTSLIGAGGAAGAIGLSSNNLKVNAHVILNYGSGGDGYTHGGAGGGTSVGNLVTPTGQYTTPLALISSMHDIGQIGNMTSIISNGKTIYTTQDIDFLNNGYGDMVYSTASPNQVVVALADANGFNGPSGEPSYWVPGDANGYIVLNSPANVEAIVAGDFTGNGHPDIAIASDTPGFVGVEVYLSQYNPQTGAFEGFSAPLFSPLPSLGNIAYGIVNSPLAVTQLLAGDFAGHGVMGLAVVAQEVLGGTTPGTLPVVIFMDGETTASHPLGTGYFYANFNDGNFPVLKAGGATPSADILKVTALSTFAPGAGNDVIIQANASSSPANESFNILSYAGDNTSKFGGGSYGLVTPPGPNPVPVQFYNTNIAITQDQTNPALADVVAIASSPAGFAVTLSGDGQGNFTVQSAHNVGINYGYDDGYNPVGMVTVPDANGYYSDIALLNYDTTTGNDYLIYQINSSLTTATPLKTSPWKAITPAAASTIVAFDAYLPNKSAPDAYGFLMADPSTSWDGLLPFGGQTIAISAPNTGAFSYVPFKVDGYFINAGSGGTSLAGSGGAGGTLGSSLAISGTTGIGTLAITLPSDLDFLGLVNLQASNGGNGFVSGGNAGTVHGVSVNFAAGTNIIYTSTSMFAGNGGQGLTGTGGAGGTISQIYAVGSYLFVAGQGGVGAVGGAGGSLLGNTEPGVISGGANNQNPDVKLVAGSGAPGIFGGGNGGNVISFVNEFYSIIGGAGGSLAYYAGNGGDSVSGQAGAGGSIIDSSPYNVNNNLNGPIYLLSGSGGSGLYGGSGGSIVNFSNLSSNNNNPTNTNMVGGNGGNSVLGAGGAGGSISGINVVAAGGGGYYNTTIAGYGGNSAGGVGGIGGAVSSVYNVAIAPTAQNVIAAGAGGSGLNGGGNGGGVANINVNAGSSASSGSGKILVIAGDGGAAYSVKPALATNAQDVALSIGGVNGPGGNGGSIINVTQSGNTQAHIDLIAGNGGATVNHSTFAGTATTDNAGTGGSVSNVSVQGSIGNSGTLSDASNPDQGLAVKSYFNPITGYASYVDSNDVLQEVYTGPTMQDFIENYILYSMPLNDTTGNVGLVAGAAGSVESAYGMSGPPTASSNGVNGSVNNVYADNIMSMVAGNVFQETVIHSLSNYGLPAGIVGTLGASKSVYYDYTAAQGNSGTDAVFLTSYDNVALNSGNPQYIAFGGMYSNNPVPVGGELIDGAFIASNGRTPLSTRDFIGPQ